MQSFLRIFKEGFSSFVRNGWLSVASITVMVLTLLTLSLFFMINVGLGDVIKSVQDKIDISVYFVENPTQSQIIDMQNELAGKSEIKSIKYISKEDALKNFRETHKNEPALLSSVSETDNSLPTSLVIKVYNPDKLSMVSATINQAKYKPLILRVSLEDNRLGIDKLLRITNFTKQLGIVFTAIFAAVSFIIIFNTVRMAIFARTEEIEIMKLVGATPGFIKGPFLVEGALYGVIATLISIILMASLLYFAAPTISKNLGDSGINPTNFLRDNFLIMTVGQLLIGLLIGMLSSWLAIRKHLRLA